MAEETIYCPSCNRKVRVPEEMLGQPVQCPLCQLIFVAPVRGPAHAASQPPPLVQPVPQPPPLVQPAPVAPSPMPAPIEPVAYAEEAEGDAVFQLVRGPAVALLILAVLGWISNVFLAVKLKNGGPESLHELITETRSTMEQIYPPGPARDQAQQMLNEEFIYNFQLTLSVVMLVLCTGAMIGAMQMLRLRSYWMAVLGSLFIMGNLTNCCCLAGIPIGIWSLSILLRPEVRRAFE
jgi:hypothetical protein